MLAAALFVITAALFIIAPNEEKSRSSSANEQIDIHNIVYQ